MFAFDPQSAGLPGDSIGRMELSVAGSKPHTQRFAVIERQSILLLVTAALVLPFMYAFFFNVAVTTVSLEGRHFGFIAMCTAANLLSGFAALRSRGRLSRRIESTLFTAAAIHGGFAIVVIAFRAYYSRPMMGTAFLVSLVLAICVCLISDRYRPRRIGIVPHSYSPELMGWVGAMSSIIPSPNAKPRDFDVVLISFDESTDRSWTRFIANAVLHGCEVRYIAEVVEELRGRVSPDHFQIEHAGANPSVGVYMYVKRIVDVILALLLLPFAVPVILVACALIKYHMGGKVLFVQKRVGQGGRTFEMYKLRTMRDPAPGATPTATSVGDPRITPLGRILRNYRIDELPQLWNVIRGDMSLIGPRPEQVSLSQSYTQAFPAFEYRHLLRPGITGWAQVKTGYAATEAETRDKLSFDLYYAKYVSARLDLKIALKTLLVVSGAKQVR